MKKLTLLVAAGAGYVLGSRAGRQRYEQIKGQATKVWNDPKVQSAVDDVQAQAKQTGADVGSKVGATVAGAASEVRSKVADKVGRGGETDPASDAYRPDDDSLGPDLSQPVPPMPGGPSVVAEPSAQHD